MDLAISQSFVDEVNAKADGLKVLERIGYAPDKIQIVGESIKAFCPIHKDKKFRSLLIDPARQSFKCTLKTCPGAHGGSYVDLYSLAKQITPVMAAADMVGALDLDVDSGWNAKIAAAMLEEATQAIMRHDSDQAESAARLALQLQSGLVEARLLLASIHAERGETLQAAEEYAALAQSYLDNQQFERADETLKSAVAAFPDSEDLLLLQVRSAELQGQTDTVVQLLQQLVRRREEQERQVDNLGLLEQLVKFEPNTHEHHLKIADVHELRHDLRSSCRALEKAVKLLQEQNRGAEAIPLLRRIIQVEPELAKFRVALAEEFINEGDYPSAKEQIFEVVNLQIEQQEYGPAARTVQRWLEIEPESMEAHESLARIYMDQERHAEAASELREAARLSSKEGNSSQALQLLFRVKFLTPDDVEVRREIISLFRKAEQLDKAGFELLDLAEVLFAAGDSAGGEQALKDAAESDESPHLQAQIADALASRGSGAAAEAMLLKMLSAAEGSGDAAAAAAATGRLLSIKPDSLDLRVKRCRYLWESGDFSTAAEETAEALPLLRECSRGGDIEDLLSAGSSFAREYSPANKKLFEAALEAGLPILASAYYHAVINGLAEIDTEAALACARAMAEADPGHSSALNDSAVLYATLGYHVEAAEAYAEMADRLFHKGDFEGALQLLEEAARQAPNRLDVYRLRASIVAKVEGSEAAQPLFQEYLAALREIGDPEESAEGYLEYIKWYPEDAEVQREAGESLAALGRGSEAAQRFQWLATDARQRGDLSVAVANQRRAVQLLPSSPVGHEQLGSDLLLVGEKSEAAGELLAAAELYSQEQMPKEALAVLRLALDADLTSPAAVELALSLSRARENSEDLAWALEKSAVQLRVTGHTEDAIVRTREWLQVDPESIAAYRMLAELQAESGDTDSALATYTGLAERLEGEQRFLEALSIHAEMGQLRAPELENLRRLTSLAERSGNAEAKQQAQIQLGLALIRVGELSEAQAIAKKLTASKKLTSSAGDLWRKLGEAFGTGPEATQAWIQAANLFSTPPENREAVFECLNSALALEPESSEAHERLAFYHEQCGEEEFAFVHRVALLPLRVTPSGAKNWNAAFERLQEQCGTNSARYFELGSRANAAGRENEAISCFEKAAVLAMAAGEPEFALQITGAQDNLTSRSLDLRNLRAAALVELGERREAVEWIKSCANHSFEQSQFQDAENLVLKWLELERSDLDALELQARIYTKLNRTQRAIEIYLHLGQLLQRSDDLAGAEAALRRLLEIDPEHIGARNLLWHLLLEAKREKDALDEMQQLTDLLIEKNLYKEATTLLSRMLDYRTNSEEVLERLASLVYEHEGFGKAAPYYKKLLALRCENRPTAEAAAEYERVLKLEGAEIDLRLEYAQFLEGAGLVAEAKQQLLLAAQTYRDELNDSVRAIQLFEHATQLEPFESDGRVYEEIAELNRSQGDDTSAARALKNAAEVYVRHGDPKRGVECLERMLLIPQETDRSEDYAALAAAYYAAGNRKKGKEAFETAFRSVVSESCLLPEEHRRATLELLLTVQPTNLECAMALLPILPTPRVGERALEIIALMREEDRREDELRLLKSARELAPSYFPIRLELINLYQASYDTAKLQIELSDLVRSAISAGQKQLAQDTLERFSALPSTPDVHLLQAQLYSSLGNTDAAVEHFAKAAEQLSEEGRPEEAAEALGQAAKRDSVAVPASTVAHLLRRAGHTVRPIAMELLEAALIARSRTRSLVIAAALLETCRKEEIDSLLSMVFMRAGAGFLAAIAGAHADWLLERQRGADALAVTQLITDLAPNSPDVWWLASQLRRRCDDKQGSADAALKAARLYNEAGAVTEEESCYREALEDLPDDAATLETLAFFYEREKRADEGVEAMRRLADLAEKAGDTAGELHWLKKAIELSPAADAVRLRYASSLSKAGRQDQALDQFIECGRRSAKAGDTAVARSAYEQVLLIEPENESAVSYLLDAAIKSGDTVATGRLTLALAEIKAEAGALTGAIQLLKKLLEQDAENEEALEKLAAISLLARDDESFRTTVSMLGQKLLKRGDYKAAIQQFENLLEQDPGNAETLQVLMDCCAAEGLTERGAQYAARVLNLARDGGDPERVRHAASNILSYDAENAEARRDLAEALLALNRVTEAVTEWSRAGEQFQAQRGNADALKCYRRIVQVSPGNLAAWRKIGDLSLSIGDTDAARGAYSHLMDSYADAGEVEKAHAIIGRLLQLDPEDTELHDQALAVYRRTNNPEQAMQQVLWLVRYHLGKNDYSEADRLVQIGMELAPESIALQQCQLEVIRKMGRTDDLLIQLRALVDKALNDGNYSVAADLLEQMRDAEPDRLDVRRELGQARMKLDDVSLAVNEFSYIVRELLSRGESEEARETADAIVSEYKNELEIRARFAELFTSEGMADVGAKHYVACADLAADAQDNSAKIHFLTLATEARPRWTEGLEKLAAANIEAGNKHEAANAYSRLAGLQLDNRKYKEAAETLQKQIALTPRDPAPRLQLVDVCERSGDREQLASALKNLADLYISIGNADDAVLAYKELATLRPDDPEILQRYIELFAQVGNELEIVDEYIKLAEAHARRGKIQEAMQTFEQVLAIDRRNPELKERYSSFLLRNGQKGRALTEMRKLAELYSGRQEPDAAVEVLHGAMALDPQNADICLALAAAQEAAGEHDEAHASYSRAAMIIAGNTLSKGIEIYQRFLEKDSHNVEVRNRLCDLLARSGKKVEAAAEARQLAEIYSSRGDMTKAETAYRTAGELMPLTLEELRAAISANAYDPALQYLDYVRYADRLFEEGDIDKALDAYRAARALNDERPEIIQKCIDCLMLVAPEAEAISDYLALAERYMQKKEPVSARKVYEHVALLDRMNTDARFGLVAAIEAEKAASATNGSKGDNEVLGRPPRKKRVGLEELLQACQDAVAER